MIKSLNDAVNSVVWGTPMLVLIIGTGIYFSCRLNFFQFCKFNYVLKSTIFSALRKDSVKKRKNSNSISQFQAMSTALAATIGTGNIAGVATAITVGGAGAVFWMWVSAFFGMMTSYAENVLGVYYRRKNKNGEWCGGAMYYLSEGLKGKKLLSRLAKPMSVLFSLFCVAASFGIGNMSQVNAIAVSLEASYGVPPLMSGIVLAAVIGVILLGGVKRIGAVAEKTVPFMAIAYIAITLTVVLVNYHQIPSVFLSIFKGALGFDAVAGGVSGTLMKNALTMGFKRGVFSNEAGLGSGVIVNSVSDVVEPAQQGMWGIFEVFFDTIIVCTLTSFTVLSTGVVGSFDKSGKALDGSALVCRALSQVFSSSAGALLSVAITLFAFTTILGWSFYGQRCLEYLCGERATAVYKIAFSLFIVFGSVSDLKLAWEISDTLNALMAIPNLIGVLILSDKVIEITKNYIDRKVVKSGLKISPMLSDCIETQFEAEKQLLDNEQ